MSTLGGAVIAAAGLGSRLGHGVPKCMIEVGGQTILTRLIEGLRPHTERIHVVIGYREELVIEYCAAHHRDVVLVRNPDFRSTNTITSYRLGARGLRGPILFTDGDLVVAPHAWREFVDGIGPDPRVGVTPATSEHAVFAHLDRSGERPMIARFSRDDHASDEWANVVIAESGMLGHEDGFVFEALTAHLPLEARSIDLAEVDTTADLVMAEAAVAGWDRSPGT